VSTHVPARSTRDGVPWSELAGIRVGCVLWGGLAVVDVGRAVCATPYAEVSVIAVLVAVSSLGMPTVTGGAAALVGWLVVDGFVEHRYGVLGYDPARDTALLILLAGLSLVATKARR
jgi:hypothetical protein